MNDLTPRYEDPDNTLLFKIAALLERPVVSSFNGRTGAVSLSTSDIASALGFTPGNPSLYVLKAGDNMSGTLLFDTNKIVLNIDGSASFVGPVTVASYVESGFIFSHFKDATTNVAPASAEVYHETTGTPVAGFGASFDITMDDATVKRQIGARFISSWTVAADATRTSQLRIFMPSSGVLTQVIAMSPTTLGFFGVAAVTRPSVPDGSSLATVIDALQALGLFNPV